jgi:hypothetical protein
MHCPNCGSDVTPGKNFCKNCGAYIAASQPTATSLNVVSANPHLSPPAPAPVPPANTLNERANIVRPAAVEPYDLSMPVAGVPTAVSPIMVAEKISHTAPVKISPTLLIGVAGGVVLIVIVVISSYFYLFSEKRVLLGEIAKGNLVKPEGNSAFDLYQEYLKSKPEADDIAEIASKAAPMLEKRGNEIFTRLREESQESEVEWAETVRVYTWLNQLRPSSNYESRKYFSGARLGLLKKDYVKAMADFQRSVELDPSSAPALNGLGRAFLRMKDKEKAKEYYQRATEVEPGWVYPWINLGRLSFEMGDYVTAEQALRRAIEIDPNKGSAHFFLGETMEKLKRPCEAVGEYKMAVENAYNTPAPAFNVDRVRNTINKLSAKHSCS